MTKGKLHLGQFVQAYIDNELASATESTRQGYSQMKAWLLLYFDASQDVRGITLQDLRSWQKLMADGLPGNKKGLAISTRNRYVKRLQMLLRAAVRAGVLQESPAEELRQESTKREGPMEELFRYCLDRETGEVTPRRDSRRLVLDVKVREECELLLKRPMEPSDLNQDFVEMMFSYYRRTGLRTVIQTRKEWFVRMNRIANHFGLAPLIDFGDVRLGRGRSWLHQRKSVPVPAPVLAESLEPDTTRGMTLETLFEEHYRRVRLVGKSANTTRLYRIAIRGYGRWLGRPAMLEDLNAASVMDFLEWMLSERTLSPWTVRREQARLISLWNFAARKKLLPEFPELSKVPVPRREPEAWSDEELTRIMRSCLAVKRPIGPIPGNLFWPALVSVIYDTAERIGAVLSARRADLSADGWLVIRAEARKGGKRDKAFRLSELTLQRLERVAECTTSPLLLPWRRSEASLFLHFGKILEEAGLPNVRRNKFHRLRRTVASKFEAAGGNATELLDHESRSITKASYLDTRVLKPSMPADIITPISEG